MKREKTLRIVLELPPKGVDFGLQKGRGSAYETVQTQRSNGEDLAFEFSVVVNDDPSLRSPDFAGSFVQGPRRERFVYIDIGTSAGQADSCWSRRMKIPLTGITTRQVDSPAVLEARVPGTGKDGGPSCATVRPIDGWQLRK